MSFAIQELCGANGCQISIGFAFVDCAALRFWTGSISDDASYAALGALLLQALDSILASLILYIYMSFFQCKFIQIKIDDAGCT